MVRDGGERGRVVREGGKEGGKRESGEGEG